MSDKKVWYEEWISYAEDRNEHPGVANDWTSSVMPQVTVIAPSGNAYKFAVHPGMHWEEIVDGIAQSEVALAYLRDSFGFTVKGQTAASVPASQPQRSNTAPPVGSGRPADQPAQQPQTEAGQTVYGVDEPCYLDHEYILEAGRMVGDPTQTGTSRVQFVYHRSLYDTGVPAFAGKEGATFAHIYEVTGYNPEDFVKGTTVEFDPPLAVVFRLGKPKPNGNGRYLEFVRIATDAADEPF